MVTTPAQKLSWPDFHSVFFKLDILGALAEFNSFDYRDPVYRSIRFNLHLHWRRTRR
jgi:hypothetical protein